jgi:RNA polymerase sigma-70 factor (ECF subfamily)
MAAAQQGDAGAYESLLISLLPVLRAFVRRRGVEASEVEDVVQEVLLLIHRARHTWRPERPFDPWMWAIARNASTDALRRQGRERSRRDAIPEEFSENFLAAGAVGEGLADPEQLLASRELEPRLADALGTLPAAQRQAMELLYVEQLSVAEAAARAGVTTTALKVRAHRGSRALRAVLGAEEES